MQQQLSQQTENNLPNKQIIPRTWIVVADSKGAHIYCKTVSRLAVIINEENDFPVRKQNGAHSNRGHSSGSRAETIHYCSNPEDRQNHLQLSSFIYKLSEILDKAEKEKIFDRLIIIAPSAVLGEMRSHFSASVQQRIMAELNKNLTRLSEKKLYDYLENILWF